MKAEVFSQILRVTFIHQEDGSWDNDPRVQSSTFRLVAKLRTTSLPTFFDVDDRYGQNLQ